MPRTHGESKRGRWTAEYRAWAGMLRRCRNQKEQNYRLYGGRGITVCDRWIDYRNFLEDMGRKPSSRHSLDRLDSNGNYEPSNCRWATVSQQARNKRWNRLISHNGKTQCMTDWARELGIKVGTLWERLRRGWGPDRALSSLDYRLLQRK